MLLERHSENPGRNPGTVRWKLWRSFWSRTLYHVKKIIIYLFCLTTSIPAVLIISILIVYDMYFYICNTYKYRNINYMYILCMICVVEHTLVWFCIWAQTGKVLMVRTAMLPLTSYVQFAYTIPPSLCMGRKTMHHAICQVVFLNHMVAGWFLLWSCILHQLKRCDVLKKPFCS